jgi:hypothetical protein
MRRSAFFVLVPGTAIVGLFLSELLQGRPFPISSVALSIVSAGALVVSIRILLPSYPETVRKRLARLDAMTEEQRREYLARMFRKQLLVVTVVLLVEIPVGALSWSYVDWRSWIVGLIATTVLFWALLAAMIVRGRISSVK